MAERTLIDAYLKLSSKLPYDLKYSDSWYIDGFYLHDEIVKVHVRAPNGEVIHLVDNMDEFPSDTLAASIIMLL